MTPTAEASAGCEQRLWRVVARVEFRARASDEAELLKSLSITVGGGVVGPVAVWPAQIKEIKE